MTLVYSVATILSHFANIANLEFIRKAGGNLGFLGALYLSPEHVPLLFSTNILLMAAFYFSLFIAAFSLTIVLIVELEHRQINFIWGVILLLINLFSVVGFIGFLSS